MMKYAAKMDDGSVSIVSLAPASVTLGGVEYRVSHTERVNGDKYRMTVYDVDNNKEITVTLPIRDSRITYHSVEATLSKSEREVVEYVEIVDDAILQDRTFRDALDLVDGVLTTDMPKAREIHRKHIREARGPKLSQADVDYFKALEAAVVTGLAPETPEYLALEATAAHKKKLRDMPQMPEIDAAQTPEELKAIWPEELT